MVGLHYCWCSSTKKCVVCGRTFTAHEYDSVPQISEHWDVKNGHYQECLSINPFSRVPFRLPQFWDDPEAFKPERFLGDKTIDPYSFLPFGAGAHMCIGHRFAVLEMSTVLATLLRSLRFESVMGMEYKRSSGITMKPNPSLVLKVEKV